jgi:ribosomal protein S18
MCKTCGVKNIKGLIYKCLMCPNTDLCKFCYEGNQHLEHDKFFVKEMANESWKIAPYRVKKTRQQLFEVIK